MLDYTISCQKALEEIGIEIENLELLETALTHPTYSYENNSVTNNQRLEFLGDSILSHVIVEYLFEKYPDKQEGFLTGIKAAVVADEFLAKAARKLKLYDYLIVGKGEEKIGGRYRDNNLADAFEAIIAAIYLDQGFDSARKFVLELFHDIMEDVIERGVKSHKTILQELLQKDYKKSVEYKVLEEKGPDHEKVYTVGIVWEGQVIAIGIGKSKQEAEKQGAKIAIEYFLNKD